MNICEGNVHNLLDSRRADKKRIINGMVVSAGNHPTEKNVLCLFLSHWVGLAPMAASH